MKDFWEAVKKVWSKYKSQIILGLALLLSLVFLGISMNNNRIQAQQSKNNIKALTDSVETYKTRSGNLAAEKTLLEGDIKTLKAANEDLYNQITELKIKKPTQIVKVETEIINEVHDTTYLVSPAPYQKKDFQFNNQWRALEGFIELKDDVLGLNFTKDETYVDYILAVKDNKVYVTSSNPYVKYREIQGFTIPEKKKPAFSLTVGPSASIGYDPINKQLGVLLGASVVFGYSILSF